jgi:molybdopterin synthase catalytic subunit
MPKRKMITNSPIDLAEVFATIGDRSAGGTVIFVGTIRNRSEGHAVTGLRYDVYEAMAEKRMRKIESEVKARWPVKRMFMVHRYGKLRLGEISVAVAVSCEHRAEAFDACRFAIDAIKKTVPLWKKEMSGRREKWVEGTPIET